MRPVPRLAGTMAGTMVPGCSAARQALLLLTLAACLALLGCGARAVEPLAFGAAPWADGEEATYDLVGGNGEPFGVVVYGIERQGDGWTMLRTIRAAGVTTTRTVQSGADLLPVRSVHTAGQTRFEVSFRSDVVERKTIKEGEAPTVEDQPRRADMVESIQLLQLVRTLPLEVGFETRVTSFSTSDGNGIPITVRVRGVETVTVPAGHFEAWRVELDLGGTRRSLWYAQGAPGLLLAEERGAGRRGQRLRSYRRTREGELEGSAAPSPGAPVPPRCVNLPFTMVTLLIQLPLMILLPFWLGLRLHRKLGVSMNVWGVGALAFVVSQVIHLPLNWALGMLGTPRALGLLPLPPLAVAAGLSAGLCEELARYGAMRWLLKKHQGWSSGVQYGAGHGGVEAMVFGALAGASLLGMFIAPWLESPTPDVAISLAEYWHAPWYLPVLGGLERVGALAFHIFMSVLVMRSVTRRQLGYLLAAIGVHTALNGITLVIQVTQGIFLTEALILVSGALMVWLVLRMREPAAA